MGPIFFQSYSLLKGSINASKSMTPLASIEAGSCYGVLYEPTSDYFENYAVLFLYPWGQDYIRSHRAIRQLAISLGTKGIASLRFDYRGTGDSGGQSEEFSLDTAIQDAQAALVYVLEATGVKEVKVFATRLGALIAFQGLATANEVSEIHTWDPVMNGQAYLEELKSIVTTSRLQHEGLTWINGYPLGVEFEQQLALAQVEPGLPVKAIFYGGQPSDSWCKAHEQQGQKLEVPFLYTANEKRWVEIDSVGGFINPHTLLKAVEQGLCKGEEV